MYEGRGGSGGVALRCGDSGMVWHTEACRSLAPSSILLVLTPALPWHPPVHLPCGSVFVFGRVPCLLSRFPSLPSFVADAPLGVVSVTAQGCHHLPSRVVAAPVSAVSAVPG